MTKRLVSTVVALGASALLSSCNFDQPKAGCVVQDAEDWFARYQLKEGTISPNTADCVERMGNIKGETFGVFKYTDPKSTDTSKLAIRPFTLTFYGPQWDPQQPQAVDPTNAVGTLPRDPPNEEDSLCPSTNMTVASAEIPVDAESTSLAEYKFENVQVYSAPSAPGTQMGGDVTITLDGCTAKYSFRALWPFVGCDPTAADACGEGSGLNPDFKVNCDANALSADVAEYYGEEAACVPTDPIPSFK
ncbi:hypothetical protein [Hyalangium versicolor]|uniref:hypothetical protein n=1 Tax=Hyalangium versicolor TaxID=2861190 RepID=UPI001CCFEF81|nr:hypothetical protein [Hyalangium versicolor]